MSVSSSHKLSISFLLASPPAPPSPPALPSLAPLPPPPPPPPPSSRDSPTLTDLTRAGALSEASSPPPPPPPLLPPSAASPCAAKLALDARRSAPGCVLNAAVLTPPPLKLAPNVAACHLCAFHAADVQSLAAHRRSAHGEKPFACVLCHKRFAERGNANKHYRVAHLNERKHRCSKCNKCFPFRDGLNRHISMVHLNHRPFQCTECMCPQGPHSPSVPCTHICAMRFKQKSHRRRHILSVHHSIGKMKCVSRASPTRTSASAAAATDHSASSSRS